MANGTATREDVATWCSCISNKKVQVGMPAILAKLAWGNPDRISDDSSGREQWVYRRGDSQTQYVYIEDGFVKSWSNN